MQEFCEEPAAPIFRLEKSVCNSSFTSGMDASNAHTNISFWLVLQGKNIETCQFSRMSDVVEHWEVSQLRHTRLQKTTDGQWSKVIETSKH